MDSSNLNIMCIKCGYGPDKDTILDVCKNCYEGDTDVYSLFDEGNDQFCCPLCDDDTALKATSFFVYWNGGDVRICDECYYARMV